MGNKADKPKTTQKPEIKLDPMEDTLTQILIRPIKENDIRFKDLDRFSHRISIFDTNESNQYIKKIYNGYKVNDDNKINDNDDDDDNIELQWQRVKNIIICISELYTKYHFTDDNDIYHNKIVNILSYSKNLANKSNELCALIMNKNDNFCNYKALNILSTLCQSNAQIAFSYLTFKYLYKIGYDSISDVPTSQGWKINIYFENNGNIRILNNKQARKTGDIKSKMEVEFKINWKMETIYKCDNNNNDENNKCLSVELASTGFAYFNEKLKKKKKEKIKTDLSNGQYIIYKYPHHQQ